MTKYKILSIDGGGMRGIMAARWLQEIEARTGMEIYKLFDLVIGTSTGGLLAAACAMPDATRFGAKFSTQDMIDIYVNGGPIIFYQSVFDKIWTLGGLADPKYDRDGIDGLLKEYFGDATLADTLIPVCLTTYDLNEAHPFFWSTFQAYSDKFTLADIAGATSAAPTYFAPKAITYPDGSVHYHVDGGMVVNNPQLVGLLQLLSHSSSLSYDDILMVSIGTGNINQSWDIATLKNGGAIDWIKGGTIVSLMMDGNSDLMDFVTSQFIHDRFRIQTDLDSELSPMDNASKEHLEKLLHKAEEYIASHNDMFDNIAACLLGQAEPDPQYTTFDLGALLHQMAGELVAEMDCAA